MWSSHLSAALVSPYKDPAAVSEYMSMNFFLPPSLSGVTWSRSVLHSFYWHIIFGWHQAQIWHRRPESHTSVTIRSDISWEPCASSTDFTYILHMMTVLAWWCSSLLTLASCWLSTHPHNKTEKSFTIDWNKRPLLSSPWCISAHYTTTSSCSLEPNIQWAFDL